MVVDGLAPGQGFAPAADPTFSARGAAGDRGQQVDCWRRRIWQRGRGGFEAFPGGMAAKLIPSGGVVANVAGSSMTFVAATPPTPGGIDLPQGRSAGPGQHDRGNGHQRRQDMARQELTPFRGVEVPAFASSAFVRLQREIDRMFDDFGRGWDRLATTPAFPKIDVSESDGEIEITAELPGMEQKDIDVSLANDVLTVSGEKRTQSEKKDKDYSVSERSYGAFSRSVALPPGIDPTAIKASVSNGVLKVTAPKPAAAKAAKIEIKSA
jgi:HSP20 family protein